jgi:hypothetical protein
MTFWHRVATGAERLTAAEDLIVWDQRATGADWDAIAAHIVTRRDDLRARTERAQQARDHANARRWREELRAGA